MWVVAWTYKQDFKVDQNPLCFAVRFNVPAIICKLECPSIA
jgi:hypothetical protein